MSSPPKAPFNYRLYYAIAGEGLDVDALLAEAPPVSEFRVWHEGDIRKPGRPAASPGMRIEILKTNSHELAPAVEAFLEKEENFLRAAGRCAGGKILALLGCRMSLHAGGSVGLWLPAPVIKRLGEYNVYLAVDGYADFEEA